MSQKEIHFNFDDVSDDGYIVVAPGRYVGEVVEWKYYTKEESGNDLFQITFELKSEKYQGERLRFWLVLSEKNRANLFRVYKALNLIKDGDRMDGKKLSVQAVFGETDSDGKINIPALVVNGESRKTIGARATVVVVSDPDYNHRIHHLEPLAPPGKVDDDLPF